MSIRVTRPAALSVAVLVVGTISAAAVDLNVTHFGTGMYGVPYAIAKEKGYFKEIGLDVTGFLTSAGGGTTVRNVLASELLCVPKTSSVLISRRNRLTSAHHDRATMFRTGRLGRAIQVEEPA